MAVLEGEDNQVSTDPVVNEAVARFRRCAEREATARKNWLADYKFAHGDSYNGYQWPDKYRNSREVDNKPCLTMNIVRQHNLQIVNEARQNKSSVTFKATGGGASKASADCVEALMRQIEYKSNAQAAYQTACQFQVFSGLGYWRLVTEYENNRSFNQCIRIKRVWDPLSIYLDPDISEENGSDAKFGFVFDLVLDTELYSAYPFLKDLLHGQAPLGTGSVDDGWAVKDHTRVCEYFRKIFKPDRLLSFVDPATGRRKEVSKSSLPKEVYKELMKAPLTKWRDTQEETVEWYLIVGDRIVDKTIWPGKYIPLIRVVGEETVIDGVLDRKGHTRALLDAQRMYNYNASSEVEFVALQGKTPWLVAAEAIEEYESMWNSANVANHSTLVYKHRDEQGADIPPPQKPPAPSGSPAYEAGMQTAFNQMMMTSGQWQNQMGMGGNERTGEAIARRQDQSMTAVYHFPDNYAQALRFTGVQILDLIPKIMDRARLMKLAMQDGEEFDLAVDPSMQQAYLQQLDADGNVVQRILNPQMGEYDVESSVGPAYGTRREETVKAMTLLLTQAPQLTPIIGDLLLGAMDIKEAQEAARRMKNMVPPQALGKGPTQNEQLLQQQVQSLTMALDKAMQQLGKEKLKLVGKEQLRDVQVYDAHTKRFSALADELPLDKAGMSQLIHQLVQDSLQTHLAPITRANKDEIDDDTMPQNRVSSAPVPGAKQAKDGHWYISDPARKGKYLRVRPQEA